MTAEPAADLRLGARGPEHAPGVHELYVRYFGNHAAQRFAARFAWQFEQNPWLRERPARCQVATVGSRVVGHQAAFPLPMRLGGQRRIVLCGSDFVADDQHRIAAVRLFRNLVAEAPVLHSGYNLGLERLLETLGVRALPLSCCRFTYALADSGRVRRALVRRLPRGLRGLAHPRLAALIARLNPPADRLPLRPAPRPGASPGLEVLTRFDARYAELWAAAAATRPCSLDKDLEYMNWRYIDGPARRVRVLGIGSGGRLLGVVVHGLVEHRLADGTDLGCDGEVLECIVRPDAPEVARLLLATAVAELATAGVDGVDAFGLSSGLHPVLLELGFVARPARERQLALVLPQGETFAADPQMWYLSSGDGDQLYGRLR